MRLPTFLTALAVAGIAAPASAADDPAPRGAVLTVRGSGLHEVRPDFARFTVTVSVRAGSLGDAQDAQAARASRAMAVLKDLERSGLIIDASRSYAREDRQAYAPRPEPPERAFLASTAFELRARNMDHLAEIMTRINGAGLFETGAITFKVDREQERAAFNAARKAAVIDAREQATVYSEAAGLKLGEIEAISDAEIRASDIKADMPMRSSIPVVAPAMIPFEASVTVTWRAAPR